MKKALFTLIAVMLCLGSAIGQQNWVKITYFRHRYLHFKINGYPASLVFDTGWATRQASRPSPYVTRTTASVCHLPFSLGRCD